MKPPKQNPCNECPFRKKSLRGYLGAATPEAFLATAHSGFVPMPCHSEVDYEATDWEQQQEHVHQCTGHAIYLSNTAKRPESPSVRTLPANRQDFLSGPPQFLAHHKGDPVEFTKLMMPGLKISRAEAKRMREQYAKAVARTSG